uniref:Uncharacterized protein n=1 Tax=Myoviridae sp. ctI7W9 TaxID=2826636 RepID=A0A8S5MNE4_9CAUD|nr:MAG TPA: hypothetical protein [Myoviridae sp. ctI7W9]
MLYSGRSTRCFSTVLGGGERLPLPLPVKGESEARFVQHR